MRPDNVVNLFDRIPPKEPQHKEYTAFIGEVEFNDEWIQDIEFEVRALAAPNSVRYWIVVEGDTAQFYPFHNLNRCFLPDAQPQEVRQWVRDVIQKEVKGRVTIV